ncbi:unnamed protein product [Chondrus crispus]|uniref:Uncharacterized protein n=1 Tax=Chondrus crispus TaxID=2769 RepID=R7QR66_CHOCR|nr:unnamed protein product [Chondrus crispus]CDF39966.1 unnamed protein product [Chondrus crispus]|eukprot:XP_005710260.1 unnamed protein product [Chondrus crispus]
MENSGAFVSPLPVLSQRRPAPVKSRVCMAADKPDEKKPSGAGKPKPGSRPKKTIKSTATWANVFLPQFGRKGPGSNPDWDLRPASLRKEEEGRGICDHCKGTGSTKCSFCSGLTHVGADGKVRPCPACDGNVTVMCSVCFGTKKQIEMTGNWWERGIASLFKE